MKPEEKPDFDLGRIDVTKPSVARMYDYYLGGHDYYEADRQACIELSRLAPSTEALARNNRRFLQRAVGVLARDYGVRQFLDHGSGLPTQDNVHQVAQRIDPDARVVYIDNDPIVLAHGRTLLDENDKTLVLQADMTDTDHIFAHPDVQQLLDFDAPVAALFVSVLHCLDDEPAAALVREVARRLVPGSFIVISHLASTDPDLRRKATDLMLANTDGHWGRVREPHEVEAYFDGMEILDPGHLVEISAWRPDTEVAPRQRTREWIEYGGIARI